MRATDRWAVVLAGGEGRRLRGFVRQVLGTERPKQFCRIVGSRSMLRHTWDRAARLVDPERIVTAITAGQERYLAEEAPRGVPGTVLVQPENKETAPGLLLPLLWIARRSPEATVAVLPADHFVWEEDRFEGYLRAAMAAARGFPGRVTLLGVEADGPETGYGWIAPGEPLAPRSVVELYAVRRFWEKPDGETAARLFARGYLWNTLVMAGRLEAFLRLARACVPHILERLQGAAEGPDASALRKAYHGMLPVNFSRTVLARQPEALTLLAVRGVCWSDWGDPDRIVQTLHRFDRRPRWWPSYALARAAGADVAI